MPQPLQWFSSDAVVVGHPGPSVEPRSIKEHFYSYPYRADAILDGWESQVLIIRAASLRGHVHRYYGTPRQDDYAIGVQRGGERILVAVADGVSQAQQSHIGSTTAVQYAIHAMGREIGEPGEENDWKKIIKHVAWQLVCKASDVFGTKDSESAEALLATTLICAVIDAQEDGTATAEIVNVGDSGAWVFDNEKIVPVVGGKSDTSEDIIASSVVPLPRVPKETITTRVQLKQGNVLLLGTDGFGDPLGDGHGEVGQFFSDIFKDRVPSMFEFAHKLDFSRDTYDDDRTLVAVWLKNSDDSKPYPVMAREAEEHSDDSVVAPPISEMQPNGERGASKKDRHQTAKSRRWRRWFVACLLLTVGALVLVSVILIAYPQMLFGR